MKLAMQLQKGAIDEIRFKEIQRLEQILIKNTFENLGDGVKSDGQYDFKADHSFTLWGETGKWEAIDAYTFKIDFEGSVETYRF